MTPIDQKLLDEIARQRAAMRHREFLRRIAWLLSLGWWSR